MVDNLPDAFIDSNIRTGVWIFTISNLSNFFLTLVSSYISAIKFSGEQLFGILFALIYTFSFIRNSSVMYRWGLGEYIAYIFIPPLFLCFYNLLRQQPKQLRWVIIFFSLILYSHVLSIVTTSFGLCCVLFSFLVQKKI